MRFIKATVASWVEMELVTTTRVKGLFTDDNFADIILPPMTVVELCTFPMVFQPAHLRAYLERQYKLYEYSRKRSC